MLPTTVISDNTPQFVEFGIQVIHLMTGEDILGKVSTDGKGFIIENPVAPLMQVDPNQPGNVRIGIAPYRPYIDKPLYVSADKVVFVSEVNAGLERVYRQATSDIQIADPSTMKSVGIKL